MPEDDGDEESDDDSDEDGDDDNEEDDSPSSSSPSERLSVWQDNIWERMEEIALDHRSGKGESRYEKVKKFFRRLTSKADMVRAPT